MPAALLFGRSMDDQPATRNPPIPGPIRRHLATGFASTICPGREAAVQS